MRVDPTLVRSGQWWDHKIPPLLAAAALTSMTSDIGGGDFLRTLGLFLVASIGVAAFGHVVNDLADIETDAVADKPNQMSGLASAERVGVVAATVAAGALPWFWLPHPPLALVLLAVEVGLLLVYSLPPIRLKDRAAAGVVADALYAYLIPVALTAVAFGEASGRAAPSWLLVAAAGIWLLLMGLRGIIWHQIADLANDRRAGVRTLATSIGAERGTSTLGALVVVEFAAAASTVALIGRDTGTRWPAILGGAYVVYRAAQMSLLWAEPLHLASLAHPSGRVRYLGFVLLNEFVEKWLPIAALTALAFREPLVWVAVTALVIGFDNALIELVRRDVRALPDAASRLAHERRSRQHIRQAAEVRLAACAAGPAPVSAEARAGRRWVFVVCGPELHVDTLRTAVAHLRPLTQLEIWVVTDPARNVHPIDTAGIDRIVDVDTPSEMDDHQASIWLKTGVHRHLPDGEWCYLDSDVIAVRPGVEEIFDHRHGPVAFASDLTISANRVDRFSPWAMNCDCSGSGDQHSCGHLREQLSLRLGVDVPGDWVHWNGGVFVFGPDSTDFLDQWHRTAVESFGWPEWRTRDQGALIATAWATGNQDCGRLPAEFNFIADLGNSDLCLDPVTGWALDPAGPWHIARFLHLYTSRLEDPAWDLNCDVEAPVIRQSMIRTKRLRRTQARQLAVHDGAHWIHMTSRDVYWWVRERVELFWLRTRRTVRRMNPDRISAGVRRRLGRRGDTPDSVEVPTPDDSSTSRNDDVAAP